MNSLIQYNTMYEKYENIVLISTPPSPLPFFSTLFITKSKELLTGEALFNGEDK